MTELALAALHDAVASAVPQRECIVHGARRLSYAEVAGRTHRLAAYLAACGLGVHRQRSELAGWESGQDHVALFMRNCPEYLESMLACFKARAVAFNVNYRYVDAELIDLLRDAGARAIVYEAAFAPTVARIREALPQLTLLIQVGEAAEGSALLSGAVDYEAAIAAGDPAGPRVAPHADDLYILYTGGTTGKPKAVLWRQADIYMTALGGRNGRGEETQSLTQVRERALGDAARVLPAPPMMHGAAHWVAFHTFHRGGTVVLQDDAQRFDAADVLRTAERERVQSLLLVGDAFGRPLSQALASGHYDLSALSTIVSSGAALSAEVKEALMARVSGLTIVDAIGSSETGQQGVNVSESGQAHSGRFALGKSACVISAELTRVLQAGDAEVGWLAQRGRVPLGYLGDADKTRRTFPIIDGQRYAVPGDRARLLSNGEIELLGRDSATINSGGEKIFAEEVEAALKRHPDVEDAVVCGRPSARWGQEVCAVVQPREGARPSEAELLAFVEQHLARYKLPKHFVFPHRIERSPSGKPDYRWARAQFI